MARAYQISCPPGSKATLADMITLAGGQVVTILNAHATEPLMIGGDENELTVVNKSVSTSNGFKLAAGASYTATLSGGEAIYGISGTSTVTITAHVFRSNKTV